MPSTIASLRDVTLREGAVALAPAVAVVLYRVTVDIGYRLLVAGPFAYQGFQNAPSLERVALSWLFLLALLPFILRLMRTERFTAQVAVVMTMVSIVPTSTLIAHDPRYSTWFVAQMFGYWAVFLAATLWVPRITPFRRPVRSHLPHSLLLGGMTATVLFVSWRYTNFRFHFGLFDIYELRAEARDYSVPTILGYVATMSDNVLPVLLAFYLRKRWLLLSTAVATVIFLNFGISATKQVLFLLVFAMISFAVTERTRLNRWVLPILLSVIVIGILEWSRFQTLFVGSIVLHRLMFIPAHLHWVYFDFFQTNELLYLTQSALRFFFDSPYQENVQFLLGEYFIGDITARANNGLFSDAYMNFGAAGVLVYPLLCVALLKLLEGAAEGLPQAVNLVLVAAVSFVVQGVPLPTALLTSGLALLVLMLATLPREWVAPTDGGLSEQGAL